MENHPDWALIARYLSEEPCSPEERRRVQSWIRADPSRKQLLEELRCILETAEDAPTPAHPPDVDEAWEEMHAEMEDVPNDRQSRESRPPIRSERRVPIWGRVATGLILLFGGLWLVHTLWGLTDQPSAPDTQQTKEIVTKKGERTQVQLVDGSSVTLNAESRLRLSPGFNQSERVVELTGEAYFDVRTDSLRPFIVETEEATVEVRGTAFNLRGYPDDRRVEVAVEEGAVEMRPKRSENKSAELRAGEIGWLADRDTAVTTQVADVSPYVGWTEGWLVFNDTRLPEVAARLERWYAVEVNVEGAPLDTLRLTAKLKSQSMRNVLDVVSASTGIRYRIDRNTVRLMPRDDTP